MNLNELNPTQIILLTLLVSFVTSISTGIVTVSLINQAPPVVTDTIHKVYEKTVEKIVPSEQKATVIENNKTIIVSDEDFVIEAVKKNSKSLARIYSEIINKDPSKKTDTLEEPKKEFVGIGLFISEEGDIVAQKQDFVTEEKVEKKFFIEYNEQKINIILDKKVNENTDFIFLKVEQPEKKIIFNSIEIENSSSLQLGQSIIVLGGEETDVLLIGIISNLTRNKIIVTEAKDDIEAVEKIIVEKIETNLSPDKTMTALINLDGKIIGIKSNEGIYTPITKVQEAFNTNYLSEIKNEKQN